MPDSLDKTVAIVGVGAIMPDAPDATAFWRNVREGRYSISEVDPSRWDPALYYDPDPHQPDKTYSKIGGWVRDWEWNPLGWKLPMPPKVSDAIDGAQKWAVACTRMALADAGWPERTLNLERTAVIIGNALAGEHHYLTALRIAFPEIARELNGAASFATLPAEVREAIERELHVNMDGLLPEVTEDTMPGELSNCVAGRVANLFDLRGPNFTVDAACASALAAMDAAVEGLVAREFDVAITGGVDRNMGAATFVKFCAIGALSPTGARPYADGADGFVMGEGAALFVVKRLADALRDEDRIYALVRGIGSASDGRGKGITAPNPIGQRLAVQRAWQAAGMSPGECTLIEGHGTSTRVGDAVELGALMEAFSGAQLAPGSIALGSVKSNIGHLKAAAGAAGMLKATLSLHDKVLPPSLNFERPNPNLDWTASPFAVNTELREWELAADRTRVAGVSAFGFGGTNFHIVMEEYLPDHHPTNGHRSTMAVSDDASAARSEAQPVPAAGKTTPVSSEPSPTYAASEPALQAGSRGKPPLRGALVLGANCEAELANELRTALAEARQGRHLAPTPPSSGALRAAERIAIDYADGADLEAKAELALRVLQAGNPDVWPALRGRGIYRGSGAPGKVAFLYTGQGSQYANMLAELRRREAVVEEVFDEADMIMAPLLKGRRLSDIVFADPTDDAAVARADQELRRTEITQPAVLTVDTALTRLLGEYGIVPELVMGHSLGEYGALIAAGAISFEAALEAVSARGHEMASLELADPGAMAAVIAPLAEVHEIVAAIDGYVVLANVNSTNQVVLGGATEAVGRAVAILQERGRTAIPLPVSHAFHTEIVAQASGPLRATLERLGLRPPQLPIVANVDGELYPSGDGVEEQMLDILARQVFSPVQFEKGLRTLYDQGARIFVEVGPKHALQGFASDVLGDNAVLSLATNHPKAGDVASFNNALCGLWAAGLGAGRDPVQRDAAQLQAGATAQPQAGASPKRRPAPVEAAPARTGDDLQQLLAEFVERGRKLLATNAEERGPVSEPVVITGAALGLPGSERVFDEENLLRLLNGEQGIDVIPARLRREMLDKQITRVVKSEDGLAKFETIDRLDAVIKLAGRAGAFDLACEFGVDDKRVAALARDTQLAIAAGIDALRDAGIPLVLRYKTTTTGTQLPDRWSLPDEFRDDTGVIFASAFPGMEEMTDEVTRYTVDHMRRQRMAALESLRARMLDHDGTDPVVLAEVQRRIHDLGRQLEQEPYTFNRRFLFRILSMGHSQLAELIGARGPNTQINSACASTTQAVGLAQDWIRAGRCRRVLVVAADDATSDTMMPWIGAGFLAAGAAATDENVEDAALPFDQRRHGMLVGMGAASLMVESAAAARERGLTPICEVLGSVFANSAFHGTRLDIEHISGVMEKLVKEAEGRGVHRDQIANELVFVSHETYTPARGGSAAAEIHALREVFGASADRIVIANTKGFTGHPMGVGLEDILAVKALETGIVPPVPNFRDPDPELGNLNLSQGGAYPIRYALRLAAGFGSQIAMTLLRWTPVADGRRRSADELGFDYRIADRDAWTAWLSRASGYPDPTLEVVQHRLRIVDQGSPALTTPPARPTAVEPALVPAQPLSATSASAEPVSATPASAEPVSATPASAEPVSATPASAEPVSMTAVSVEAASVEPAPSVVMAPAPEVASVTEPAGSATDGVEARVLAIVAAQTGYPEDLLDMDLDLEADLGVDTVKQAEVFATVREEYGIERDDSLKLRDYPTLNHVVGFVRDRAGLQASAAPVTSTEADMTAPEEAVSAATPSAAPLENADAQGFLRRVPVPVLRPPLTQCVLSGLALGEGSRVVMMPDTGGVSNALAERLGKLGVEVLMISGAPDAETLKQRIAEWATAGPIQGVYWLAALDDEGPLGGLDARARRDALHVRVKLLAVTMRALADRVSGEGTFLVSGTRLGGRHGYDADGAVSVLGGAVTGFTKALSRERPQAHVKAVDFGSGSDATSLAEILLAETLRDPGAVEIGYADDLRWSVALIEQVAEHDQGREPDRETVFMVTGAAGSIVSAIICDLAAVTGGTFHLLDLVPAPDPADLDLSRSSTDRDGLKDELAGRIRERGERPTPKLVERELARIERARAALDAIDAIERSGGKAHWHQVDLTDAEQVSGAVAAVVQASGRIDVLLHCAGVEISHFLTDKRQREYDLVFDVKAHGWLNILAALEDVGPVQETGPDCAIVFSSIAGRFGNGGQTDYSAANDLLCKSVSNMRRAGSTRGVAIDWTAWGEIGMASRGSIPKLMEAAGIGMLPTSVGVPVVHRELAASGPGREVVVAASLGVMLEERHPTGGLDVESVAAALAQRSGPMTGAITGFSASGTVTVVTELDPGRQAFLNDHRIDGTPVLPGVMGIEGFAEVAAALVPGFKAVAFEDIELLAPFKFYRDEPRTVTLRAVLHDGGDGTVIADCELIGRRSLRGQGEQETRHFSGRARLARKASAAPKAIARPAEESEDHPGVGRDAVYGVYFHGPAYQVLDRAWRDNGHVVGSLAAGLPADHEPPSQPTELAPRLIELCFQTAGVWELGTAGRMALPTHVDRVVQFAVGKEPGRLWAVVSRSERGVDAEVVDESGRVLVRLEGYRTIELPGQIEAAALAAIRAAMGEGRGD
jgi:acyl transferase domain-containing protein/acyl carrier protein